MTVKDPLEAADAVVALAEGAGGRVDDRSEHAATKDDVGTAELTIRLPAEEVSGAVDGLRELGTIDQLNLTSEDVTGTAQDLDARIRALQLSVARMEDLLTRATTNEQLIAAENALTERQSSLEQLQSERARLAEKVRLSTIHVVLYGPELAPVAPVEPADRTAVVPRRSGGRLGRPGGRRGGVAIVVGVLLPWLAFGGAVAALVVAAVRWNRRRRATGPIGAAGARRRDLGPSRSAGRARAALSDGDVRAAPRAAVRQSPTARRSGSRRASPGTTSSSGGVRAAGQLVLAGPFLDTEGAGMTILEVESAEEAQRLATQDDQAVVDGVLAVTVRPWRVVMSGTSPRPRGAPRRPSAPRPRRRWTSCSPRPAGRPGPASASRTSRSPRRRAARAVTSRVRSSLPNATLTCVNTTSLRISAPSIAAIPSAIARALAARPSTRSATPVRPSDRSAAHTGTPRARRDSSGTRSIGSPAPWNAAKYSACMPKAAPQRLGARDDREAAVVRHVEGLVGVGRPRVRPLVARPADPAAAGRPPPTARTRRRRAPRRRARGPPRWPRPSGRTRRSAGCRPAGTRSSDRRRRPAPRRAESTTSRP